jgi:hypothetical protein
LGEYLRIIHPTTSRASNGQSQVVDRFDDIGLMNSGMGSIPVRRLGVDDAVGEAEGICQVRRNGHVLEELVRQICSGRGVASARKSRL